MAQLESRYNDFEDAGAMLLAIVAQRAGGLLGVRRFLGGRRLPFPLLLDEKRQVCRSYGVYHLIGPDAINISRPAAFVIDRGGTIRYIYVGSNQTDRPSVDEMLAQLRSLSS